MWNQVVSGLEHFLPASCLMLGYAGSLLLAIRSAVCLLPIKRQQNARNERRYALLATVLFACVVADVASWIRRSESVSREFLLVAGAIAITLSAAWLFHRQALQLAGARSRLRLMTGVVAVVCLGSVTAWSGTRLHEMATEKNALLDSAYVGDLTVIPGVTAITDAGTKIPVYRFRPVSGSSLLFQSTSPVFHDWETRWRNEVMQLSPVDHAANCHGWVFTGGRYLVKGDDVPQILSDNHYEQVCVPEDGDLVVYRDRKGWVSHTGIVRGTLQSGAVLVESKWAVAGRYLHEVQKQPFSQEFVYYRNPARKGHLLTVATSRPSAGSSHPPVQAEVQPTTKDAPLLSTKL